MAYEQAAGLWPWQTYSAAEDTRGHIMASLRRCNQGRLLVERFRVEQQSIHVEDNGGWHVREFHNVWVGEGEDNSAR